MFKSAKMMKAAPMMESAQMMKAAPIMEAAQMMEEAPVRSAAAKVSAPPVPSAPLPSFDTVIQGQSTNGSWDSSQASILASCIIGNTTEDPSVREALGQTSLKSGYKQEQVYLTLLALFILQECFYDYEDEWDLIARKAKTFLQQAGIQKPDQLVNQFNFQQTFEETRVNQPT